MSGPMNGQGKAVLYGAIITASVGLIAALFRWGIPWLLRKGHRALTELEFAEEIARGKSTAAAVEQIKRDVERIETEVKRLESALEDAANLSAHNQEVMLKDIREVRTYIIDFLKQLGQIKGGRRSYDPRGDEPK